MRATGLEHLESGSEIKETLVANENVMICCGRMGPMCMPVYKAMEQLQPRYSHVVFRDVDFDTPAAHLIKNLPQCASFWGLPFTVYFKKIDNPRKLLRLPESATLEEIKKAY